MEYGSHRHKILWKMYVHCIRFSHKAAFHFQTNVTKVDTEKQDKYTVVHYTSANQNNTSIKAQRVFMCVNRRLGSVRRVEYNNESKFKGHICYGVQDDVKDLNWKDKTVLILGAGASD